MKKLFIRATALIVLGCILLTSSAFAAEVRTTVLEDGYSGHWCFFNGMASIRHGSQYNFVNHLGEVVSDTDFDSVDIFSDGLAAVEIDGKWGYIDKTGQFVIEPMYDSAKTFYSNTSVVQSGDTYYIINQNNEIIKTLSSNYRYHVTETGIRFFDDYSCGYMYFDGSIMIQPIYKWIYTPVYENGKYYASVNNSSYEYALIDSTGNTIIPYCKNVWIEHGIAFAGGSDGIKTAYHLDGSPILTGYSHMSASPDGNLMVYNYRAVDDNTYKPFCEFFDLDGNLIFEVGHGGVSVFSNGLVAAYDYDGVFDYSEILSYTNQEPYRYSYTYPSGYMDMSGDFAIAAKYCSALDFQNGVALVMVDNPLTNKHFSGFIDTNGNEIISPTYSTSYLSGYAISPNWVYDNGLLIMRNDDYSASGYANDSSIILFDFRDYLLEPADDIYVSSHVSYNAVPTSSTVLVDGEETGFDAYNINDNNYFKLRDIAMVLDGSDVQFDVSWDNENDAINMLSDDNYTAVGAELSIGNAKAQSASLFAGAIYIDGEEVILTAYNIAGNNYFKLRDLAEAFDFNLTWNGETNTIEIISDESYSG